MVELKKEVKLKEGNIGLVLDSYNDIFSSFDPRGFSEKAISDDFLIECKRAARDKEGNLEIVLFIPKERREIDDESTIKRRLKIHFQRHYIDAEKEIKSLKREGAIWFLLGAVVMATSSYFYEHQGLISELFFIITQPAGWFFFWEGLGKIFIDAKEKTPKYSFYQKMTRAAITFKNI